MNKVPKCKECEFHIPQYLGCGYVKNESHYCHFVKNGVEIGCGYGKWIKSKEYVTSPKWCPRRENGINIK